MRIISFILTLIFVIPTTWATPRHAGVDRTLNVEIEHFHEMQNSVYRNCVQNPKRATYRVTVNGQSLNCDNLLRAVNTVKADIDRKVTALKASCETPSGNEALNAQAADSLRIARAAASCPKKPSDAVCAGQAACAMATVAMPLLSTLSQFGSAAGVRNSCLNTGNNCMQAVFRGIINDLWGTLTSLWDGAKWLAGKAYDGAAYVAQRTGEWLGIVRRHEASSSDKALAAQQVGPTFLQKFRAHPIDTIKALAKSVYEGMTQAAMKTYGCEEWTLPGGRVVSDTASMFMRGARCTRPMTNWNCASCDQKIKVFCAIGGMAAGEILQLLLTGGIVGGAKVIAASIAKAAANGSKIARAAVATGRTVKAVFSVIPKVAGGVVRVGGAALRLTGASHIYSAAERAAVAAWEAAGKTGLARELARAGATTSGRAAGAVAKVVGTVVNPVTYLHAMEAVTNVGERAVVGGLERAGVATAGDVARTTEAANAARASGTNPATVVEDATDDLQGNAVSELSSIDSATNPRTAAENGASLLGGIDNSALAATGRRAIDEVDETGAALSRGSTAPGTGTPARTSDDAGLIVGRSDPAAPPPTRTPAAATTATEDSGLIVGGSDASTVSAGAARTDGTVIRSADAASPAVTRSASADARVATTDAAKPSTTPKILSEEAQRALQLETDATKATLDGLIVRDLPSANVDLYHTIISGSDGDLNYVVGKLRGSGIEITEANLARARTKQGADRLYSLFGKEAPTDVSASLKTLVREREELTISAVNRDRQNLARDADVKDVECSTLNLAYPGAFMPEAGCKEIKFTKESKGNYCTCNDTLTNRKPGPWFLPCAADLIDYRTPVGILDQSSLPSKTIRRCWKADLPEGLTCYQGGLGPKFSGYGGAAQILCQGSWMEEALEAGGPTRRSVLASGRPPIKFPPNDPSNTWKISRMTFVSEKPELQELSNMGRLCQDAAAASSNGTMRTCNGAAIESMRRRYLEIKERGRLSETEVREVDTYLDFLQGRRDIRPNGELGSTFEPGPLTRASSPGVAPVRTPAISDTLRRAAGYTDAQRVEAASNLVARPLTRTQQDAILRSHNVGAGTGRGFFTYTADEIREKGLILRDAGFSAPEIRTLVTDGITGDLPGVAGATRSIARAEPLGRSDAIMAIDRANKEFGILDRNLQRVKPGNIDTFPEAERAAQLQAREDVRASRATIKAAYMDSGEGFANAGAELIREGNRGLGLQNVTNSITNFTRAGNPERALAEARYGISQGMTPQGVIDGVLARRADFNRALLAKPNDPILLAQQKASNQLISDLRAEYRIPDPAAAVARPVTPTVRPTTVSTPPPARPAATPSLEVSRTPTSSPAPAIETAPAAPAAPVVEAPVIPDVPAAPTPYRMPDNTPRKTLLEEATAYRLGTFGKSKDPSKAAGLFYQAERESIQTEAIREIRSGTGETRFFDGPLRDAFRQSMEGDGTVARAIIEDIFKAGGETKGNHLINLMINEIESSGLSKYGTTEARRNMMAIGRFVEEKYKNGFYTQGSVVRRWITHNDY